jgi:hypothetical protein
MKRVNRTDFKVFESEALAAGYDEALVREWQPHAVIEHHAHPFDADAVVTGRHLRAAPRHAACGALWGGRGDLLGGAAQSALRRRPGVLRDASRRRA